MAEDMVTPIASDPVTSAALTDYRSQRDYTQPRPASAVQDSPLPPVPTPVPTPVPSPAIVPPIEAFAAALVAAEQPTPAADALAATRLTASWSPPPSDLALTDRLV